MKRVTFLFSLLSATIMTYSQTTYKPLYRKVPNFIEATNEESEATTGGILRISKVSVPGYSFFSAGESSSPKPCIIICPGGGYGILASQHEGTDVAQWLNSIGVHAVVLKYRIPSDVHQKDRKWAPLQDAQQAIALVRKHAKAWGVNANKVGIMGFSAGGHLASSLGVHYKDPVVPGMSAKTNIRPDFQVLGYPVVSFGKYAHLGSRNNLLGKDTTAEWISYFSNELQVDAKTPPAFLVHAKDDKAVPIENSLQYVEALKNNGVAAELFTYEKGGHGFGMKNKTSDLLWTDALQAWLKRQGIL